MITDNKDLDKAIDVINKYIQENLYYLHPKTTDRWWDVKRAIDVLERNRHRGPDDPIAFF